MCNTHMKQHAIEAKVLLGERLALETCLQQWKWKPCDGACVICTEEKGVRGLFHAWNLLKYHEVDIYLYIYGCIQDNSKAGMIGTKELWSGQTRNSNSVMLRLSMQVWSAVRTNDLDVQSILRAVEAAVATLASLQTERSSPVGGTCFFLSVFSFSQKLCRVLYMSWMRRRLWFDHKDHKYPWILWCAMATCTWYIRGVKEVLAKRWWLPHNSCRHVNVNKFA